jgi:hypothetical protein
MRVIGRLLLILAVAVPSMWLVAMGVASGDGGSGPAVMKCGHWDDDMFLSPGATNNPSNQQVTGHGKLFGCNKAGGGGVFNATLSMTNATCSNVAMSGSAQFDWTNGSHSSAFLNFQPQSLAPSKVVVSGTITSGAFQGLIIRSELRFTQVFQGSGPNCTPQNPLKKIEFTNSRSYQLLTPNTQPTTPPTKPPPTNPPPVNPPPVNPPPNNPPPNNPPVTQGGGPPATIVVINRFRPRRDIVIVRRFPRGTLAFTGSRSGTAAMVGLEALLLGGALACLNPDRARRMARFGRRGRTAHKFLNVTLPPR